MWQLSQTCSLMIIAFLISQHVGVECDQIKARYDLRELAKMNLRVLIPEISGVLMFNPKDRVPAAADIVDLIDRLSAIFNRSELYVMNVDSGTSDEYGNYSGMVGTVQRGEADVAFAMVRPDALPFEPVRIGSAVCADEPMLFLGNWHGPTKFLDVILIVYNFDLLTYSYIFYCTYCVIALSIIGHVLHKFRVKKRSTIVNYQTVRLIWKKLYIHIWSICEIFLDQENLNPIRWSDRILWLHYCLACFITIFGFFLNLMSTEMMTVSKLPHIETIEDLFNDPYFAKMRVTTITDFPSYSVIKTASANTSLGKLNKMLNIDPAYSLYHIDNENLAELQQRAAWVEDAFRGAETSFIASDYSVEALMISVCINSPNAALKFYTSQSFAEGILTYYFSKQLDDRALRYLTSKYNIAMEAGLYGRIAKGTIKALWVDMVALNYGWSAMKCFEKLGIDDPVRSNQDLAVMGLKLESMPLTFRLCGYCISAALLVLLIEVVLSKKPSSTGWRRYSKRKGRIFARFYRLKLLKFGRLLMSASYLVIRRSNRVNTLT